MAAKKEKGGMKMRTIIGIIIGFCIGGPIGAIIGAMIANDPFTGMTQHSD